MGLVVVRAGRAVGASSSEAISTLVYQAVFYVLLLAALYLVNLVRYGKPFWRALGWTLAFPAAWIYLALSPLLALGLSALGVLLKTPVIENPIELLISGGA